MESVKSGQRITDVEGHDQCIFTVGIITRSPTGNVIPEIGVHGLRIQIRNPHFEGDAVTSDLVDMILGQEHEFLRQAKAPMVRQGGDFEHMEIEVLPSGEKVGAELATFADENQLETALSTNFVGEEVAGPGV